MVSKSFFIFFVFIITWTCLIETTVGSAGRCYQCNSNLPACDLNIDPVTLQYYTTPCNGQCYMRVKDGILSRGCSWEFGFMAPQASSIPIYDQQAMWLFCDTPFCNGNVNPAG